MLLEGVIHVMQEFLPVMALVHETVVVELHIPYELPYVSRIIPHERGSILYRFAVSLLRFIRCDDLRDILRMLREVRHPYLDT